MSYKHPHAESPPKNAETVQELWHRLEWRLESLMRADQSHGSQLAGLERVESLLHSLPLASGEFGVAQNRIQNARRYYQSSEIGAARYELHLLASSLRQRLTDSGP